MSRHPTFEAPLPSSHDELFVIKSIQAFHNALNSISTQSRSQIVPVGQVSYYNRFRPIRELGKIGGDISYLLTKAVDQSPVASYHQSHVGNQFRSSSLKGVEFSNQLVNQSQKDMLIFSHNFSPLEGVNSCSQSTSQSHACMQNRDCTSSPREVDFPCSGRFDQSQLSMQMRYAKPEVFDQTYCLRPQNSVTLWILQIISLKTLLSTLLYITLILLLILLTSQTTHLNKQIFSTLLKIFLPVLLIFVPQVNKDPDSQKFTL